MAIRALPVLLVYSREGCHLCDEMISGLHELRARFPFTVEVVDVDKDPALAVRYGEHVPVLSADGRELCRYHLDPGRVAHWLDHARQTSRG